MMSPAPGRIRGAARSEVDRLWRASPECSVFAPCWSSLSCETLSPGSWRKPHDPSGWLRLAAYRWPGQQLTRPRWIRLSAVERWLAQRYVVSIQARAVLCRWLPAASDQRPLGPIRLRRESRGRPDAIPGCRKFDAMAAKAARASGHQRSIDGGCSVLSGHGPGVLSHSSLTASADRDGRHRARSMTDAVRAGANTRPEAVTGPERKEQTSEGKHCHRPGRCVGAI